MKLVHRALAAPIAWALACSPAVAEDEKPVVGLVMKSLANEFFKSMEEGARKFAQADGSFTLVPVGTTKSTPVW